MRDDHTVTIFPAEMAFNTKMNEERTVISIDLQFYF